MVSFKMLLNHSCVMFSLIQFLCLSRHICYCHYYATGGPPLGYFDWNMIEQALWGGVESAALFGAASLAMELAFRQKWISKFD